MCVCVLPDVEVLHIDILVGSGLPLAPQKKTLLRRGLCNEEEEDKEKKRRRGAAAGVKGEKEVCISLMSPHYTELSALTCLTNGAEAERKKLQSSFMWG